MDIHSFLHLGDDDYTVDQSSSTQQELLTSNKNKIETSNLLDVFRQLSNDMDKVKDELLKLPLSGVHRHDLQKQEQALQDTIVRIDNLYQKQLSTGQKNKQYKHDITSAYQEVRTKISQAQAIVAAKESYSIESESEIKQLYYDVIKDKVNLDHPELTIVCRDGVKLKINVPALSGRSKYFHTFALGKWTKPEMKKISMPEDFSVSAISGALYFLYTGKLDQVSKFTEDIQELIDVLNYLQADKGMIDALKISKMQGIEYWNEVDCPPERPNPSIQQETYGVMTPNDCEKIILKHKKQFAKMNPEERQQQFGLLAQALISGINQNTIKNIGLELEDVFEKLEEKEVGEEILNDLLPAFKEVIKACDLWVAENLYPDVGEVTGLDLSTVPFDKNVYSKLPTYQSTSTELSEDIFERLKDTIRNNPYMPGINLAESPINESQLAELMMLFDDEGRLENLGRFKIDVTGCPNISNETRMLLEGTMVNLNNKVTDAQLWLLLNRFKNDFDPAILEDLSQTELTDASLDIISEYIQNTSNDSGKSPKIGLNLNSNKKITAERLGRFLESEGASLVALGLKDCSAANDPKWLTKALSYCPNLKRLRLSQPTYFSDINALLKFQQNLEELRLDNFPNITRDELAQLLEQHPGLNVQFMGPSPYFPDDINLLQGNWRYTTIVHLDSLKLLLLERCGAPSRKIRNILRIYPQQPYLTDKGLALIAKNWPDIKKIELYHNNHISGAGLKALASIPNLRILELGGCPGLQKNDYYKLDPKNDFLQLETLLIGYNHTLKPDNEFLYRLSDNKFKVKFRFTTHTVSRMMKELFRSKGRSLKSDQIRSFLASDGLTPYEYLTLKKLPEDMAKLLPNKIILNSFDPVTLEDIASECKSEHIVINDAKITPATAAKITFPELKKVEFIHMDFDVVKAFLKNHPNCKNVKIKMCYFTKAEIKELDEFMDNAKSADIQMKIVLPMPMQKSRISASSSFSSSSSSSSPSTSTSSPSTSTSSSSPSSSSSSPSTQGV